MDSKNIQEWRKYWYFPNAAQKNPAVFAFQLVEKTQIEL